MNKKAVSTALFDYTGAAGKPLERNRKPRLTAPPTLGARQYATFINRITPPKLAAEKFAGMFRQADNDVFPGGSPVFN